MKSFYEGVEHSNSFFIMLENILNSEKVSSFWTLERWPSIYSLVVRFYLALAYHSLSNNSMPSVASCLFSQRLFPLMINRRMEKREESKRSKEKMKEKVCFYQIEKNHDLRILRDIYRVAKNIDLISNVYLSNIWKCFSFELLHWLIQIKFLFLKSLLNQMEALESFI